MKFYLRVVWGLRELTHYQTFTVHPTCWGVGPRNSEKVTAWVVLVEDSFAPGWCVRGLFVFPNVNNYEDPSLIADLRPDNVRCRSQDDPTTAITTPGNSELKSNKRLYIFFQSCTK